MKNKYLKIDNNEEILTFFSDLATKYNFPNRTDGYKRAVYLIICDGYLNVSNGSCSWVESNAGDAEEISFLELVNLIKSGQKITVFLNKEYNAIVSRGGIEVGCQTFPLSIVDKLVEAVKQLNNE